jgi:hypothetical protein
LSSLYPCLLNPISGSSQNPLIKQDSPKKWIFLFHLLDYIPAVIIIIILAYLMCCYLLRYNKELFIFLFQQLLNINHQFIIYSFQNQQFYKII